MPELNGTFQGIGHDSGVPRLSCVVKGGGGGKTQKKRVSEPNDPTKQLQHSKA